MDEGTATQAEAMRRRRLVQRVDQMVRSGRLTEEEAGRLRAAGRPGEFDDVVRDIRARHAGRSLGVAVREGRLSQEEADGLLRRLKDGEHSASFRAQIRKLRGGAGSGAPVPDSAVPEAQGEEDSVARAYRTPQPPIARGVT